MKKRSLPKNSNREKIRRERDPIPWRYCFLTLFCGVLLVCGFFLAARSHFSAIDLGMKNSSLKKQIEELEAEKRRLLLSKEIALSPGEIKKAAKKLGLTDMTAANIETSRPATAKTEKSASAFAEKSKPATEAKKSEEKPEERIGKTGVQKEKPGVAKKDAKTPTQVAKR